MKIRRSLAAAAAVITLTAAAGTGTASAAGAPGAAAAVRPPAPHCDSKLWHGPATVHCTCPRGWHVHYSHWWDWLAEHPACARNHR
jgi:hypothetical protein